MGGERIFPNKVSEFVGRGSTYAYLRSTAFQPLYGQVANILGRRWLIMFAIVLFMLGSGLSGGASTMNMLILGRTIQGIGGAGVTMMVDLIVSDLVPLRERGTVMGIIFGAVTVGTALGPFLGGIIIQTSTWRWVFYLNLPIGAVALVLLVLFLRVNYVKDLSLKARLRRIDFAGNAIFVLAVIAILIASSNGGTMYTWSSWRTILPLVLGFIGLGLFYVYERLVSNIEPTLRRQLFANRTSATAFTLTLIHTLIMNWSIYFLPVYFQAVLESTPVRSGVQLLPTVIVLMLFAAIGGIMVEKSGRYRPTHYAGFALMTIGLGLFSLLDAASSTAVWVMFQFIFAAGLGLPIGTLLVAAQAELSEKDTATATATWAVFRSFGAIWGITISGAVFNNEFANLSYGISDIGVREFLSGGEAYSHSTSSFIGSLDDRSGLKGQVIGVYTQSLKLVWRVSIAISGLGFFLVWLEREVKLRTEVKTDFGLKEKDNNVKESTAG